MDQSGQNPGKARKMEPLPQQGPLQAGRGTGSSTPLEVSSGPPSRATTDGWRLAASPALDTASLPASGRGKPFPSHPLASATRGPRQARSSTAPLRSGCKSNLCLSSAVSCQLYVQLSHSGPPPTAGRLVQGGGGRGGSLPTQRLLPRFHSVSQRQHYRVPAIQR